MTDKPVKRAPKTELQCFWELESLGLLDEEWDRWYSPYKAEHSHYSLRLAAYRKGWPQPPGGPIAL